jgi:hypothetical protein
MTDSPLNNISEITTQISNFDTAKGRGNTELGNRPSIYKAGKGVQDVITAKVDKPKILQLADEIVVIRDHYTKMCEDGVSPTSCQGKIKVCNELITQLSRLYEITYGGKRKTSKGYTKRSDHKRSDHKRNRKNTKRNRKYRSQKA